MTEPMLAYHNDPAVKAKYLQRVALHRAADELIQGTGWERGKGCAVGCTLEAYDHKRYPIELGIPEQLAHLEDRLFELQSVADAQLWPERFLSAIRPGADLSRVWPEWAIWMLTDPERGVIRHADDRGRAAIERVAELYRNGGTAEEFCVAAAAADAAYAAAAYAAAYAAAADAAADAAYAAAADAAYAAYAAAADAAADAAYAAAGADAARSEWVRAACDKLIALLEAA